MMDGTKPVLRAALDNDGDGEDAVIGKMAKTWRSCCPLMKMEIHILYFWVTDATAALDGQLRWDNYLIPR